MRTPVLDPTLVSAPKKLKLGHIADTLPDRLVLAEKQELSFEALVLLVLSDEIARRDSTSAQRRACDAGLEAAMAIERWDPSAKVTYDKRVFAELMSLRFIEAHQNAVILGPVGVGKTFLANALGHVACRHRYHVMFTRADEMLRKLKQSRLDNSRDVLMTQLATTDLLIIDSSTTLRSSDDARGELRRISTLCRTYRASVHDCHEQPRHRRVARDLRRRTARTERRRSLQERRVRPRRRRRVVPRQTQAEGAGRQPSTRSACHEARAPIRKRKR